MLPQPAVGPAREDPDLGLEETRPAQHPREPGVGGVSPSSMRASVSAISEVVADVNHLTPCKL